jgi:phage terminase large subunit GpA-like protein
MNIPTQPLPSWDHTTLTLKDILRKACKRFLPPPKISTTEWANKYRYLAAEASALPGKYSTALTPWIPGIHDALDDPNTWMVVCMKSAQVAWTDGVINNYIAKRIDIEPCPIIILFAKEGDAQSYSAEKFQPMVEATPRLRKKVSTKSKRSDNRQLFKKFPGGFLKLVGSNSPGSVKSTPAPIVFTEEPDDCSSNVKDQGDSIKLLEERTKTFARRKVVRGGTPSVKGISRIEADYKVSDQRKFMVPCHDCGKSHVLDWDYVRWEKDLTANHEVYGKHRPETAFYTCPHCGSIWTDVQKNRNVRNGEWEATKEFRGVAGFFINELYSPFPGSKLNRLVERYVEAWCKKEQGDDDDYIVFVNSALGKPYEIESDAPGGTELADRAHDYAEKTVPNGGIVLTVGIDVQHDRFAVVVRAWGRDQESWLVYWGELYGRINDHADTVWEELNRLIFGPFQHESGSTVHASAISIDSSDGQTNDAVYDWVRKYKNRRNVMAIKGASNDSREAEIFRLPKKVDTNKDNTKAASYGLQVYIIGTHKAKNLIDSRLKLPSGSGPGRMHCYKSVREDYYEQITSEVLVPVRTRNGRKDNWQKKSGVRNEGLDCEVYCLHAARSLKVHLLKPSAWDELERQVLQSDMFSEVEHERPESTKAPAKKSNRVISRGIEA